MRTHMSLKDYAKRVPLLPHILKDSVNLLNMEMK